MYIPQYMPFLQISHVYQEIDIYISFFASVRELDFKVVITVGLQDISSMYIKKEVFLFLYKHVKSEKRACAVVYILYR